MDGKANRPGPTTRSLLRQVHRDPNQERSITSSSSSSSASTLSPTDFVRNVQAAFKRHRPLGTMQSNNIKPRRTMLAQREISKNTVSNAGKVLDAKKSQKAVPLSQRHVVGKKKSTVAVTGDTLEDASITAPSISGTITKTYDESFNQFDVKKNQKKSEIGSKINDPFSMSRVEAQNIPAVEGQKKVQFSLGNNDISMETDSIQAEASAIDQDFKHHGFHNMESDSSLRSDGGISSLLPKRTTKVQDQMHQLGNFLRSDFNNPMTQSSVVGSSSCATTTSVHSTSAPMLNSTTHYSHSSLGDSNKNLQPIKEGDKVHQSHYLSKYTAQNSTSVIETEIEVKDNSLSKEKEHGLSKDICISNKSVPPDDNSTKGKELAAEDKSENPSKDVNLEHSKLEKVEKVPGGKAVSEKPRKKGYDPDMFFKVNGKLYQRLGKIGSGGSSEVHKVISSDCKIFALKKIKLKGRDHATAYGFCQEIEYLKKLKGKNNIIQLIDYEVTDKTCLEEVMSGSLSIKDGRVKDDGYIYMVLEYGEIDLAHMLSQKWKEMGSSDLSIDENWLRFYWQQILLAVNTIHEERIVHSDLKPANFLLVKGSLKLIDFGIAKAIMSDTTHIQRDSQVGTLSYMSPEAFMCNDHDSNGNTIKCGRPSDIWSLGCILYQMVYGRTPFSEYKTFWAKFKVITNRNQDIHYGPVSNPLLLDLMKKCLAWDQNERWRIPQLLQHPFLAPPVPPSQLSSSLDVRCRLLQLIVESYGTERDALSYCSQIQKLLTDPVMPIMPQLSTSRGECFKLVNQLSKLFFQLENCLANAR